MERTLVLLKPDAVQRRLVGAIIHRLENKGLKLVGLKLTRVTPELARRMYAVHEGKDFYAPLLEFITAGPVVACALQGVGAVAVVRKLMGATFGPDAAPGTIRGDWGMSRRYNLIHASDSPQAAAAELGLFFTEGELQSYDTQDRWLYAQSGNDLI
jgi:nucleoside-diphosphate kinase